MISKVSLISGKGRKENINRALELIRDDIKKAVGNKNLVIKPNLVSTTRQSAATHVGCLRSILNFFSRFYKKKMIIAESSPNNTKRGFENFDYYDLEKEYNVELRDLNYDSYEFFELPFKTEKKIFKEVKNLKIRNFDDCQKLKNFWSFQDPNIIRVSKTLLDKKNFIISSALLKTHDTVIATLSWKNVLMGSLIVDEKSNDKDKMHKSIKELNLLLGCLAEEVKPDLALIDGFGGMEGDGPTHGETINTNLAIASLDALAADRVALEIMGIKKEDIGYLNYIARKKLGEFNLEKIKILGDSLEKNKFKFKMHSTYNYQINWR